MKLKSLLFSLLLIPSYSFSNTLKELTSIEDGAFSDIWKGDYSALRKKVAQHLNLSVRTEYKGYTLLHAAAMFNNGDIVRYLLELGLDVNAQDNEGNTPLHLAVFYAKADNILSLLGTLWNPNVCIDISIKNKKGLTAFELLEKEIQSCREFITRTDVPESIIEAAKDRLEQYDKISKRFLKLYSYTHWVKTLIKK